jgi:hypothetical protein
MAYERKSRPPKTADISAHEYLHRDGLVASIFFIFIPLDKARVPTLSRVLCKTGIDNLFVSLITTLVLFSNTFNSGCVISSAIKSRSIF